MASVTAPRFTIVLPLKDGGEMLRECVRSILAQSEPGFELRVLENGSRDGGPGWIASIGDPRIHVHPAPSPLSMEHNWARILEVPRLEFMTLIGHDDRLDPNFLAAMSRLIERHPGAGLYRAHFSIIDGRGRVLRRCMPMPEVEDAAPYLAERFAGRRDSYSGCVFRSADYDRIGGMPMFPRLLFADDALWIALMGSRHAVTTREHLFDLRMHAGSGSWSPPLETVLDAWDAWRARLAAVHDSEIAEVVRRHAPAYLSRLLGDAYLDTLKRACSEGRRVDEALERRLFQTLDRESAETSAAMLEDPGVRLWRGLNAAPWRQPAGLAWRALRSARRVVAGQ